MEDRRKITMMKVKFELTKEGVESPTKLFSTIKLEQEVLWGDGKNVAYINSNGWWVTQDDQKLWNVVRISQ